MNLKERLTSTEKLLRSIRSGEALPSPEQKEQAPSSQGSIWTRPISLGNVFSGLKRRDKTPPPEPAPQNAAPVPAPAAPAPAAPASAAAPVSASAAHGSAPAPRPVPAAQADAPAAVPAPEAIAPRPLVMPGPGPARAKPFWARQIHFGGSGKTHCVGVSVSGPSLCLAVVRQSSGSLEAARRFPMEADQAPGEKGFPAFLSACLEALGYAHASADLWAVLRSSDLDLNVLTVPKLSGAKLDAAAYWTLQKEKKFADAEYALDYLVFGPTAESKEPRLDLLTCLARRSDVERLRDAFRDAGRPLTGVTAIPNALLALYRRPGAPTGYAMAANIHVEPDYSAIGLYAKDRLLFSRFIRSGAGSMAETLAEHFQALARPKPAALADLELPLPGSAEQPAPEPADQPQPLDAAQAHELMRHVLLGAPCPDFVAPGHLLSPQEMLEVLSPAIERLARQVERTLEYYATSQQGRCDALHLSGEIFGCPAIAQALAGQLGFSPVVFDASAILRNSQTQASPADGLALTPAIAAALAKADKGVNLIANYKVRTAQEAKRLVTRSVILGLAGVMVLIGAAGVVLEQANAVKQRELAVLKARAAALGPMADEATLKLAVERYSQRQEALRKASARLLASASLDDIARRAPENIRLLALNVEYPVEQEAKPGGPAQPGATPQPGKARNGAEAALPKGTVLVEGVVLGERSGFDAALSRFVINLQASPMFQMPVVNESGLKELGTGEQVLHFVMHVGVR